MKRLLLSALVVLFAIPAQAQVDRATLSGTVRDPLGAVVSGASVVITNSATNVASSTKTNAEGNYTAVNLRPGRYVVEVEAAGFQKTSQAIVLEIGQRARADFSLGVGDAQRSRGGARHAAACSTPSRPRWARSSSRTPSPTCLSPRATGTTCCSWWPESRATATRTRAGGTSFGRTGGVNVHGQRSLQNNFTLDGVDNNTISENVQELTTQVSRPSIDAIQEFKIVTSPYSAEYGRAPGGAISVSTKSGTNEIHGTAYEYFRNDSLDAIDYFSELNKQPKLANNQNQFGGNLVGADPEGPRLLLRGLRGTAPHARSDAQHARAHRRREAGSLRGGDPRSRSRDRTSPTTPSRRIAGTPWPRP